MQVPNEYPSGLRREIIAFLSQFVTPRRLDILTEALANRTRYITVALEDIYQSQNASAVLRTCECYGIQDVHIIENTNRFDVNPRVVKGASQWLTLHKYKSGANNSLAAIECLRAQGYRIVATSPHAAHELDSFDIRRGRFALFFGTELQGLTRTVMDNADEFIRIPTVGLTESLNLSVTAAICIHTLLMRLRAQELPIGLSVEESEKLMHLWLRLSIRSWKSLEKRFLSTTQALG